MMKENSILWLDEVNVELDSKRLIHIFKRMLLEVMYRLLYQYS